MVNGQGATAYELLTRFPAGAVAADAELIALMAAGELTRGSADEAGRYLARAARGFEGGEGPVPVPAERRGRMQIFLAIVRLGLARQRGDLPAVAEEAQRLLAPAQAADAGQLRPGAGRRALAVINLSIAKA